MRTQNMNDLLTPKVLISIAAFLIPTIGGALVFYGQLQERQVQLEKQFQSLSLPDTSVIKERLSKVEERSVNTQRELESLASFVNDRVEDIYTQLNYAVNPLEGQL